MLYNFHNYRIIFQTTQSDCPGLMLWLGCPALQLKVPCMCLDNWIHCSAIFPWTCPEKSCPNLAGFWPSRGRTRSLHLSPCGAGSHRCTALCSSIFNNTLTRTRTTFYEQNIC